MPAVTRQKITFGEMHASGVRGVLVAHIAPDLVARPLADHAVNLKEMLP